MNLGKDSESLCVEFTEGNPEMHVRVKRTGLGLPSRKPTQVPTETDLGLLPGPARPWEPGSRWAMVALAGPLEAPRGPGAARAGLTAAASLLLLPGCPGRSRRAPR